MGSSASTAAAERRGSKQKTAHKKAPDASPATLWASAYRFRELYDPASHSVSLRPGSGSSPSSFVRARAEAETRGHQNELFFELATTTRWQNQQVRALFATYQKICLCTQSADGDGDRLFDFRSFATFFFPPSASTPPPPRSVQRRMFTSLFATDRGGLVSFPAFVAGVSRVEHGSRSDKARLVFEWFTSSPASPVPSPTSSAASASSAALPCAWSLSDARAFLSFALSSGSVPRSIPPESLRQEVTLGSMVAEAEANSWMDRVEGAVDELVRGTVEAQAAAAATAEAAVNSPSSPSAASNASSPSSPSPPASNGALAAISWPAFRSWTRGRVRLRFLLSTALCLGRALPSPRAEAEAMSSLWSSETPLEVGQEYFVLSEAWWRRWKKYTAFREPGEEQTDDTSAGASAPNGEDDDDGQASDTESEGEDGATPTAGGRKTPPPAASAAAPASASAVPATPQRTRTLSSVGTDHHPPATPASIHVAGFTPAKPPAPASSSSLEVVGNVRMHYASSSAAADDDANTRESNSASAARVSVQLTTIPGRPGSSTGAPPRPPPPASSLLGSFGALSSPSPSPLPPASASSAAAASAARRLKQSLRPGVIDQTALACPFHAGAVAAALVEREDFLFVPPAVWRELKDAYGIEGAEYSRRVIWTGTSATKAKRIDLYPLFLRVCRVGKEAPHPCADEAAGVPLEGALVSLPSVGATMRDLEERVVDLFYPLDARASPNEVKPLRNVRMWLNDPDSDWRMVQADQLSESAESFELQSGDTLLVELEPKKKGALSSPPRWFMDSRPQPRKWSELRAGDTLDARDKQGVWYAAWVKHLHEATPDRESAVTVHFVGWDEKWNERIAVSSLCRCKVACTCAGRLAKGGAQVRFKEGKDTGPGGSAASSSASSSSLRGLIGLQNLGNTCFMASCVQCLSACPFFISNYFLRDRHLPELNKSNILGHRGLVATEFANLVKELWAEPKSGRFAMAVAPTRFKRVLSDFAPQFEGYQQHDSHELLAFLLDGLHEDLNRVLKKVPTKAVESGGRSDAVVVRESWAVYKLRNQSIVVDLFMGMLKSTVICPEASCGKVSVTFDPFRYLTVPLPQFTDRQFIVTLVEMRENKPLVNYGIILPDHATVAQLKEHLARLCGLSAQRLLICDVHKFKLYRVLMDTKRVSTIRENDVLVAYEYTADAFRETSGLTPTTSAARASDSASSSSSVSTSISSVSLSNGGSSSNSPTAAHATLQLNPGTIYLQAIHKYIQTDAAGHQSMSPRFGIPVCLTTLATSTNRRVHQLVRTAVQRWTPSMPGRQELPYTLRIVDHTCSRCGVCAEATNCGGCCLADDDRACGLDGGYALCILWENDAVCRAVKASMDDSRIVDHSSMAIKVRTDKSVTLKDCLELFSRQETLAKEDAFYCSQCKQHQQASKQLQVFHAPEILVVHLKRFLQINRIRREKQTTMVDFDVKGFDLTPYIPPHALANEAPPIYDLFAISNHSGGLSGGHYTAFTQHAESKRWYLFDDSRVSEVKVEQIKTAYAYMLFYKKRG